ncbi:MAG: polysaccharide deacetylase family protein [Acidobacteria bacterium]|nr:polysaccharide deacetylase family protein [Acidobacteriota bacterium]
MQHCSIIIPTLFRASLLRETLESLSHQTDRDFEVIVVCDGEDPQTRELADRYTATYPLRWVFHDQNEGQAVARNRGAQEALGEFLLFLDDDTTPSADWVSRHVGGHAKYGLGRDVVVCGRILEIYPYPPRSHTDRFLRVEREHQIAALEDSCQRRQADFSRYACFGLNSSIRRSLFLTTGGFDSALRFVGEDFELGTRLHNDGIQFFFERCAIVRHRNTKDLVDHFNFTLPFMAQHDLHRVRKRGQKMEQTRRLVSMDSGKLAKRLAHRAAWHFPEFFRGGSTLCQWVVDATGWEPLFHLWNRLHMAVYWQNLRSQGVTREWLRKCAGSAGRALMFHSVSVPEDGVVSRYCVSPQRFSCFMAWLQMAGYKPSLPDESFAKSASPHSVILTFDDGYENFYREVFPPLQRMGWKATVFLVVDRIGQTNVWDTGRHPERRLLSLEQIREMHRYGIQFGSHSLTHPFLTRLSDQDLRREVGDSKARLEDLVGSEVSCFAYPYGDMDLRVRGTVAEAGYKLAMTTQEGVNFWTDPLCLKRVHVGETDTLLEFALKLFTGKDYRRSLRQRL